MGDISAKDYLKKIGRANRGKEFEDTIEKMNEKYRIEKRGRVTKTPAPMRIIGRQGPAFLCVHEKKGPLDFQGSIDGHAFWFDCKEISGVRFPFCNIAEHQLEFCEDHEDGPTPCFFLINFKDHNKVFKVWYTAIKFYIREGKKSFSIKELEKLSFSGFYVNIVKNYDYAWSN